MIGTDLMPASYKHIFDAGNHRFCFFCEASGIAVYTTGIIRANSTQAALALAWEQEGMRQFNRCMKCGKWVCDVMYNADIGNCVLCTPWEDPPRYCPACGTETQKGDSYCRKCGGKLQYNEVPLHA